MSKRLDWDKAKKQPPQPNDDHKATNKQRAFILTLMPDFPRKRLLKITVAEAATIIDVRLGKQKAEKQNKPRRTNITSIQAEACTKHNVSGEVRVTYVRRDRLTPGVRTRTSGVAVAESIPAE